MAARLRRETTLNITTPLRTATRMRALRSSRRRSSCALPLGTVQEAKDWYYSPLYQDAVKHRLGTARSRAVIVEKLPQA